MKALFSCYNNVYLLTLYEKTAASLRDNKSPMKLLKAADRNQSVLVQTRRLGITSGLWRTDGDVLSLFVWAAMATGGSAATCLPVSSQPSVKVCLHADGCFHEERYSHGGRSDLGSRSARIWREKHLMKSKTQPQILNHLRHVWISFNILIWN